MKNFAILSSLLGLSLGSGSFNYQITSIDGTATVRSYELNNQTDRVWLTGKALDSDGSDSASIDAVAFGMQNGDVGQDGLGFYYGTLQADGTFSIGTGSLTTSFSGSLSEIALNIKGLAPYRNYDGTPGFQYVPGKDHFSGQEADADCLVGYSTAYQAFEDLGWSPIQVSQSDCSNVGGDAGCVVYHFSTSSTGTTGVTASVDMYVTTQPIIVNGGATVTPDDFKIDVSYTWPSSRYPADCDGECSLVLIAVAGGKAITGDASAVVDVTGSGATGYSTFTASAGKASYFSWSSDVTVDGAASTMYSSLITGDNVTELSASCTGDITYWMQHTTACEVNGVWKIIYLAYQLFGWELRLYFFSVREVGATSVDWDPQLGGANCETNPEEEVCSSAPAIASLLLASLFF